jgi:hypothetical protein
MAGKEIKRLSADEAHSVSVVPKAWDESADKSSETKKDDEPEPAAPMVPVSALFRFYSAEDRALLTVGAIFCMIGGASVGTAVQVERNAVDS